MIASVGFIGLGSQGAPMARRIVEEGHKLTLWARRPESLLPFADTAASVAATPADLAAACELVCICVVDDLGVAEIADQLIPAMKSGSILVIHSTIHPESCKKLSEKCSVRGIALLDAPVSGGGSGASEKTLTVMIGGDAGVLERARPVFESFAGTIVHLGDVGAGQTAKLINNMLMAANMGLAHHSLAMGDALGVDRTALASLIKNSSGRSFGMEVYARLPNPRAFNHGGKLLAKDAGLLAALIGPNPDLTSMENAALPFLALTSE